MSATTAGSVKAYLETLGLGVPVFRDAAPNPEALPFIVVQEGVSLVADLDGDLGDTASAGTVREEVTVSLWQRWRGADGKPAESYDLPHDLLRGLRRAPAGALPAIAGRHVYGVTRAFAVRLLQRDENVLQHAVTVTVHRQA